MPRIWLRIGMQKTGTTAVQSWLSENQDPLRDRGLLYYRPSAKKSCSGPLVQALADGPTAYQPMVAQLVDAIETCPTDVRDVLISSENFSVHAPQMARPLLEALEGYDLRILVWLRRQDMFAEALLKQWIKWNGNKAQNVNAAMARLIRPLLDYDQLLTSWQTTFPQATILPQIYGEHLPEKPGPDSIAALLNAMDLGHLIPKDSAARRSNVSPQAELVNLYKTLEHPMRVRRANRELMKRHPDGFAGRADLFTPDERAKILADYAPSNARLCAQWFPERSHLFDPDTPYTGTSNADAVTAFRKIYDTL